MPNHFALAPAGPALLSACAVVPPPGPPAAPLEGSYWRLTRLGEHPAVVADNSAEAHFRFAPGSGAAGCNRLARSYTRDGDGLRFGPAATARMACAAPALAAHEHALLTALASTTRHAIAGDVLTPSGADGPPTRFTAAVMQ
jgi:heat shock protein HslJ